MSLLQTELTMRVISTRSFGSLTVLSTNSHPRCNKVQVFHNLPYAERISGTKFEGLPEGGGGGGGVRVLCTQHIHINDVIVLYLLVLCIFDNRSMGDKDGFQLELDHKVR